MTQTPDDAPPPDYDALAREAEMGYTREPDGRWMSIQDMLRSTTDATAWAKAFIDQFGDSEGTGGIGVCPDEVTMTVWFANAFDAGRHPVRSGEASPWREPAAETEDYPNLVVHDGRVTGQITIGHSRLPVSAILGTAIAESWDSVEDGWSPTEHYGFTEDDLIAFLYDLLDVRGEFSRLLLALANANRLDAERDDAVLSEHADADGVALVKVWPPGDDDSVEMPDPWWLDPELRAPVIDALRRCLAAIAPG